MIDIDIILIDRDIYYRYRCENDKCSKNPKYTDKNGIIKLGTNVIIIGYHSYADYYCEECAEILYNKLKSKLDRKLWAFK